MNNKYKEMPCIRWGIIGCGDVTEFKSGPAYQQTEGFELGAVMRRNRDKAEDYAKRHGVPKFYDDAEQLIADPEIDAVYIATPPDSHMTYALKVAKAGKACCIEKPMACNYQESLSIYEAFKEAQVPLFIAYYRRTLTRFLQVKQWLDNSEIGKIRHIDWSLCQPPGRVDRSGEANWRTDVKVAPGGYFDDLASHGLNLFHFLLGEIVDASGYSKNQQGLYAAPDAVTGSWVHKSGATGSGHWNFGCFNREDKVAIYGNEGKISFSIFDNVPLVLETSKGIRQLQIKNPQHIQAPHVFAMNRHLRDHNFKHPSTGASAVHTAWVMDRILGF